MKTIGSLGGMSWESTSIYYRLINQLTRLHRGSDPIATPFDISVRLGCVPDPSGNTEATALTRSVPSVAIVGAGFCGTVMAINLLRLSGSEPLRVVLIDRERAARGTAFADRPYPYLLNVPAGRMSATSADPLEFVRYARRRCPGVTTADFLPRSLYGEYLEWTLLAAELASPVAQLRRVNASVSFVGRSGPGSPFRVQLEDGREVIADDVVLALGNAPPAPLPGDEALLGSSCYVSDPWGTPDRFRAGQTALVVGAGLRMADVVLSGMHAAHGMARVHVISRHGLLPHAQIQLREVRREVDARPLLHAAAFSMRQLFGLVREMADEAEKNGGDWREVITLVRAHAPKLWLRLPLRERRRFLRHALAYWNIHRHLLPSETARELDRLRHAQKLELHAGRILGFERIGHQVCVSWCPRGQERTSTLVVDRVVNCTGPDRRCVRSRDPLVRSLVAAGLMQPDALGIGVRTTAVGALLDARGFTTPGLYYIGPMLRANQWEATAVQELRGHAEQLARHLAVPTLRRAVAGLR
jgi:uncharacterized NAD(P)/FAD-binding protein YdhS